MLSATFHHLMCFFCSHKTIEKVIIQKEKVLHYLLTIPCLILQVLFRSGVLNQLEAKRDELLSDRIIQLQSYCRGYLARRRVGHLRVQVWHIVRFKCSIVLSLTRE